MRTTEELTQLAIDVVTNKAFMTRDAQVAQLSFMTILALLPQESREKMAADDPQAFYEYFDKSLDRSINGYPAFASVKWVTGEEWPIFQEIYLAKYHALYGESGGTQ